HDEAPPHVDELVRVPLVLGGDGDRLERHAADRAVPRADLADLRVHRAGVRPRVRRAGALRRRLPRARAGAVPVVAAPCRLLLLLRLARPRPLEHRLRVRLELRLAAGAAEPDLGPLVHEVMRPVRFHLHPAHRVDEHALVARSRLGHAHPHNAAGADVQAPGRPLELHRKVWSIRTRAMTSGQSKKMQWGTRVGVILAVSGSAVGLGNFLRFPGQAVNNGGGAFMIPYLIAMVLLALPIGWAEWAMARHGGHKGFHSGPAIMGVAGKG